ncbi:g2812 [Coccomyxa viridis]|uniref:G2812 protein n=1 Tax=Coccomyxa viridis TaxID=1274662 RepID=A0ABP1FLA4_9CHLO
MKYTDLWHRLGHQTVSVRPPTSSIIVPGLGDRSAQSFLEEVHEAQCRRPSRPTVYHIFSNAGFIFLGTMLRLLALQDESIFRQIARHPERLRMLEAKKPVVLLSVLDPTQGIILDSAPARLTPDIASRGLTAALLGQAAAGIESRHPYMTRAAKATLQPLLGFPPISTRIHEVWQAWQVVAPVKPQLYLSSEADALIPPAEIELFMKQQASRGLRITSRHFADSAHCEHYRRYPAEYCNELESFLSKLT